MYIFMKLQVRNRTRNEYICMLKGFSKLGVIFLYSCEIQLEKSV